MYQAKIAALFSHQSRLKLILLSALCLLLVGSLALAQSGRKQKKSTPEPPPQGVKMPEEKTETKGHSDSDDPESEEKKEKAPAWRMLVGTAMQDNFNVPMMYTDVAREGCLVELKRNPLLQVTAAGNMTRGEAIEAAKKDDKLYVLWMELVVDNFTASTRDGFDLRYMLYEPKTARVIGSGSGYPVQSTNMPLPTIGMNSAQYRVHLAGRDVARQVMSRLNMQPKGRFPYDETSDLRPQTSEDVWKPGVHNPRTRQAKACGLSPISRAGIHFFAHS